jgi:hypothetical protein
VCAPINMQYIVRIPSFKHAECFQYVQQNTTPSKAYSPAYYSKVELLKVITPATFGTCEYISHWTAKNSKSKCEPGGILITPHGH